MTTTFEKAEWDLDELLYGDLEDRVSQLKERGERFQTQAAELVQTPTKDILVAEFEILVDQLSTLLEDTHRIYAGADMQLDTDTANADYAKTFSLATDLKAEIKNMTDPFILWVADSTRLGDEQFERLVKSLGEDEAFLREERRLGQYKQSEEVERVLTLKNSTGAERYETFHTILTSRMRYTRRKIQAEKLQLMWMDPDPQVRRRAYEALNSGFKEEAKILGPLFIARVKDYINEQVKIRGYRTPLSARNHANNIPDEAIGTMLEVTRRNIGVFQRYFKLKKELIGFKGPRLNRADIIAPSKGKSGRIYTFDEAARMSLDTFRSLSPRLHDIAYAILANNHVHSADGDNKRGGGYCYELPHGVLPFIFINFHGSPLNAKTLTHELGHGTQYVIGGENQGFKTIECTIPMAEVPSMFPETLQGQIMIQEAENDDVRRDLLSNDIARAYGSIMRQAYFTLFEIAAHDQIAAGGVSVEDLAELYLGNLKEQFGDSMHVHEDFGYEFLRIPHFLRNPFYCYSYTFAHLVALSLYEQYQQEGQSFVPKYEKLLGYGRSRPVDEVFLELGIDIRSPEFWQSGFDFLDRQVKELEQLV